MTTKETKNTTNTNETTENEKNTVKRTNKKTVGLIVGATVTVAAVIISMLCLTSCKDNKPTATADEVIGTSVQTVTQVVTDSQGNTHIEEETKVVEVKQTKPSEKSENETSAAKNDDKSNNGNSNQSSNNSNSDAGINKQTNLNNTSNNSQSNKTNNSSNSSNSSSAGQTSKPSSGSSSSSSSSQSKPSSGSGSSSNKPSSSSQTEVSDPHAGKTWHEAEYKTEKVWVVDEEACTWQRPIYEEHEAAICNTCGAEITDCYGEHMKEHMQKGENGSYRCETVRTLVGYETVEEPEVGHWETKTELVREAGWY
jgi:hypothetical protein